MPNPDILKKHLCFALIPSYATSEMSHRDIGFIWCLVGLARKPLPQSFDC